MSEAKMDEIEIVLPDNDAPISVEGAAKPGPTIDEATEELKRQLAEATEARARAETDAQTAKRESLQFRTQAETAQYTAISRALESATGAVEAAEAAYAAALEAGDYKAAAKANTALTKAAGQVATLETGKAQMEARSRDPRYQQAQQPDPTSFEAQVSRLSPRSQQWMRAHPEAITNPAKNARVVLAHHEAVESGIPVDSDAYFAFVEQKMGYRQAPPVQRERSAQPSAPVNGQARQPAGKVVDGNIVRPNARMIEAAKTAGVPLKDYAYQVKRGVERGEDWALELTQSVN